MAVTLKGMQKNAQTRNRTGGPTMATLDFTTKPFALEKAPRRGIEPRSTTRQAVILATKLSRMFSCKSLILNRHIGSTPLNQTFGLPDGIHLV